MQRTDLRWAGQFLKKREYVSFQARKSSRKEREREREREREGEGEGEGEGEREIYPSLEALLSENNDNVYCSFFSFLGAVWSFCLGMLLGQIIAGL
jgi:hypothetical protein